MRVLLIEDALGDALLVTRRLERELGSLERISIERARTLQEGLDHLGKQTTDVVLLDLHLPDSAGTATVHRLREAHPQVPIVVFTSGTDEELVLRALKAGAQDWLGKHDFETGPPIHRCLRNAVERMRISGDHQRLQDELEQVERMQSLGVLGTGAASGFSQLIGAILDHTEAALAELADAPKSRAAIHLLEMRKAAFRASELASHLSEYARSDCRATQPIDLSEFVAAERALLAAIAGSRIDLACELERPGPIASLNPIELRQLLFNLVINASKAIGPRSGWIRVQTGRLWADRELLEKGRGAPRLSEGAYALVSVTHSGPRRAEHAPSHAPDSSFAAPLPRRGLGLAAALGIVRRHGGWIGADDDPSGSGTRFQVLLPMSD